MEQSGEYRIAARREDVWSALNAPDVLGACIEGCQRVEKLDDEHFEVAVKAKVGPVSATFNAALELSDIEAPVSYTINGNAKGGAAGFAKGSANVHLDEDDGVTVLRYGVKANVGGKLAQVGSRLVDGAARKMADDFFAEFSKRLDPDSVAVATAATDTDAAEEREFEKSGGWLMWVVAFVGLAIAVILAF